MFTRRSGPNIRMIHTMSCAIASLPTSTLRSIARRSRLSFGQEQRKRPRAASALQKLASRAYPGQESTDLFQRLLVNQFIDGLPSPELRLHVRSASPNNLAQAVQRALEMAAIFDAEQRRSNGAAIAGASPIPAAIFAVRGSSTALPPAPATSMTSTIGMTSASGGNYVHDQMFVLDKVLQRLDSISLSLSSQSPGSFLPSAHASGSRGWSDSSQSAQQVRRCFNCGQTGHLVRACPNYPAGACTV